MHSKSTSILFLGLVVLIVWAENTLCKRKHPPITVRMTGLQFGFSIFLLARPSQVVVFVLPLIP